MSTPDPATIDNRTLAERLAQDMAVPPELLVSGANHWSSGSPGPIPDAPILGVATPHEYAVPWDAVMTQLGQMAMRVRTIRDRLGDELVGIYPMTGAAVPATAVALATGVPVVSWVGSGVILVGLVARGCAEAQRRVDQLGEGLAGVLWTFRAASAPDVITTAAFPGMDPIDGFPVEAAAGMGDAWLVMPWGAETIERTGP